MIVGQVAYFLHRKFLWEILQSFTALRVLRSSIPTLQAPLNLLKDDDTM